MTRMAQAHAVLVQNDDVRKLATGVAASRKLVYDSLKSHPFHFVKPALGRTAARCMLLEFPVALVGAAVKTDCCCRG